VSAVGRWLHREATPWFRAQPRAAAAVAACLFVGITILRWLFGQQGDATSVLYVVPIALLALTFGVRGGLIGAALGFGLFLGWALKLGHLSVLGWVVRGTAMFLTGYLLGSAADAISRHESAISTEQERRFRLEEENRRHTEATEINDSILQHLVAAKWQIEQDRTAEAIGTLTETIERSQELVGGLLTRRISALVGTFPAEDGSRT
jgi:glucose-6-phosphate-specific signal transduction histidine kinase